MGTCRKESLPIGLKDSCSVEVHCTGPQAEFLGSAALPLTFNYVTLGNSFNLSVPLFSLRVKWNLQFQSHWIAVRSK